MNILDDAQQKNLEIEKRNLLRKITTEIGLIFVPVIVYFFYLSGEYMETTGFVAQLQEKIQLLQHLQNDGPTIDELQSFVAEVPLTAKFPQDIFREPQLLQAILKKPDGVTETYANWIVKELANNSQLSSSAKINEQIIGGILPVYGAGGQSVLTSTPEMNIQSLVKHVEERFLKPYQLKSASAISFGQFEMKKDETQQFTYGENRLPLEIQWKISNIYAFLNFIQQSGEITIKKNTFVTNKTDYIFSNLLVSLARVEIKMPLAGTSSSEEVRASIDLVFYVRGISFPQITDMLTKVKQQSSELLGRTQKILKLCSSLQSKVSACHDDTNAALLSEMRTNSVELGKIQASLTKKVLKENDLDYSNTARQLQSELARLSVFERRVKDAELIIK